MRKTDCSVSYPLTYRFFFWIILAIPGFPAASFAQAGGLILSGTDIRLVSSGSPYVVLNNADWTNNASSSSFAPGAATVLFTGNTGNNQINGSAPTTFYTLQSDKPGQELQLAADISASNQALLIAGNVNLQNQTLDLLGTGSLAGEVYPNGQRFYCVDNNSGRIRANRTLISGTNTNIAGLALDLNVSGAAPGPTVLYRGHDAQTSTAMGGSTSIGRYYDITPTLNTGFTYTFVFRYHEQELGAVFESNFVLYRSPSYAANTDDWEEWGFDNGPLSPGYPSVGLAIHNTIANTITLTGINSFSRWTTSNALVNPLPIKLLSFGADCDEHRIIRLYWSTASEINNEKFLVERSRDLYTWEYIATLPGMGNSNAISNYQTVDTHPLSGLAYYRLTQIDYDGASETFSPISVTCQSGENNGLSVYPNPATERFTVSMQTDDAETDVQILLTDMNGKVLQTRSVNLQQGRNDFQFEREGIASGTYTVQLKSPHMQSYPFKLVLY